MNFKGPFQPKAFYHTVINYITTTKKEKPQKFESLRLKTLEMVKEQITCKSRHRKTLSVCDAT